MTPTPQSNLQIAIACGGTGGHLFPGIAVAEELQRRGCSVRLIVSEKAVDQLALRSVSGLQTFTLPAVGLRRGHAVAFIAGVWRSFRQSLRIFETWSPDAVLAMGGFTSAGPILAGKRVKAQTFLHESNTIPGRANRWFSRLVNETFVGFPQAVTRLSGQVRVTGTPVRAKFCGLNVANSRVALGLDPVAPVLLVMGGSQGASAINSLMVEAAPVLGNGLRELQIIHLTGANPAVDMRAVYARAGLRAKVFDFMVEMELALGAATVAVSRSGASSLAEFAAAGLPPVLIPYPSAVDDHQTHNALAFQRTNAALVFVQQTGAGKVLAQILLELLNDADRRDKMRQALARWHTPEAASRIAEEMLERIRSIAKPRHHRVSSTGSAASGCSTADSRSSCVVESAGLSSSNHQSSALA